MVLAWTGLPQLLLIPLVPMLMKRFDIRYITFVGVAQFAALWFMNTHMSLNYSGDQLFWPNVVRAVGQALILTPLTAIAMMSIQPKDAANASGLFNMLRNLGGTIVTKREQFHSNIIGHAVTTAREAVRQRLDQMTNYFMAHGVSDHAAAQHQAVIALGRTVKRQALVMGFSDTFAVIGIMLAVAAVVVLLARRGQGGSTAAAH